MNALTSGSSKYAACPFVLAAALLLAAAAGCHQVRYSSAQEAKYVKPTVAVMAFQNRAPASYPWDIGSGLAEELTHRLIKTRRYQVLERAQVDAIFAELDRARQQGPAGLRQVNYLVKGVITDFGEVATADTAARLLDVELLGARSYWVVAIDLQVVDAATGELIASETIAARQRPETGSVQADFNQMAFGGHIFYETPLGHATDDVLDDAVEKVTRAISERPFQLKIALITAGNDIVVNGGRNRHVKVGDIYIVRPRPSAVTDPDTGRVLGQVSGRPVGSVRITQVYEKHAMARVVYGSGFDVGQALFPADQEPPGSATTRSPY